MGREKYAPDALLEEVVALRAQVAEFEELMRAIRSGEVDALFVGQGDDCRTLTLGDAGANYRALVEAMSEGAAIVQGDGTLLYCNSRLAAMLGKPLEAVIGASLLHFVAPVERLTAARLLVTGQVRAVSRELTLQRHGGGTLPVQWSTSPLVIGGHTGVCVVATDLTERYRVQEALRSLSLVDELTGLFNRRGFITHAEQQLKLARRIEGQLLLVFADLDGLKRINDELGHQAGDDAIKAAAKVLQRSFRESDIISRLGGDEFAVLANCTDGHAVEVIQQRLQKHVDEHNANDGRPYRLSLSVGIIPYDPAQPAPVLELLTRADAAMYANKRDKRRLAAAPVALAGLPAPVRPVADDVPPPGPSSALSAVAEARAFAQATLDSMTANICVLDGDSRIISVNRAWRDFALANGATDPTDYIGTRYIDICMADDGPHAAQSRCLARGLADVMAGHRARFEQEYPCHAPQARRWFKVVVVRFGSAREPQVMVYHEEITAAVIMEDCLSETLRPREAPEQEARDGIFIIQDDHFVFINHACAEILHAPDEQLIGQCITAVLTPEQAARWRESPAMLAACPDATVHLQLADGTHVDAGITLMQTMYCGQQAWLGTLRLWAAVALGARPD